MIEINLLPQELRVKTGIGAIEPRKFLYIIPLLFALLILIHILLLAAGMIKGYQLGALNNKWKALGPEREALKKLSEEYQASSADSRIIQQLGGRRLKWSGKLNALSLSLPSGVWLNELVSSRKDFVLKGSVISLQKEEMALVNKLIESLKNDNLFFADFEDLGLNSVQIRTLGGYDILDFILTGKFKKR